MPETNDLVLRYQFESYMECGSGNSKTFQLIGEGFTSFPEAKNPKEYTRKYINYKTEKTDVIGYSPSVSYSCDTIYGDPVVQEIVSITDNELVGNDAHRDIVSVNCWEETETAGTYKAFKRTYAVIPGNKGDGTDALIYTGTMKAVSDLIVGTFNRANKTFTAAASAASSGN